MPRWLEHKVWAKIPEEQRPIYAVGGVLATLFKNSHGMPIDKLLKKKKVKYKIKRPYFSFAYAINAPLRTAILLGKVIEGMYTYTAYALELSKQYPKSLVFVADVRWLPKWKWKWKHKTDKLYLPGDVLYPVLQRLLERQINLSKGVAVTDGVLFDQPCCRIWDTISKTFFLYLLINDERITLVGCLNMAKLRLHPPLTNA